MNTKKNTLLKVLLKVVLAISIVLFLFSSFYLLSRGDVIALTGKKPAQTGWEIDHPPDVAAESSGENDSVKIRPILINHFSEIISISYPEKEALGNDIKLEIALDRSSERIGVSHVLVRINSSGFNHVPANEIRIKPGESRYFILNTDSEGKKMALLIFEIIPKKGFINSRTTTYNAVINVGVVKSKKQAKNMESIMNIVQKVSSSIGLPALIVLFITRYLDRKKE